MSGKLTKIHDKQTGKFVQQITPAMIADILYRTNQNGETKISACSENGIAPNSFDYHVINNTDVYRSGEYIYRKHAINELFPAAIKRAHDILENGTDSAATNLIKTILSDNLFNSHSTNNTQININLGDYDGIDDSEFLKIAYGDLEHNDKKD